MDTLRAVSTASGGVIFVPDTIERGCNNARKKARFTYAELAGETQQKPAMRKPLTTRLLETLGLRRAA